MKSTNRQTPDTNTTDTMTTFNQHIARIAVGGYNDAQDIRQASMNRIRDIVRKKNEGIPFDAVEEKKDDDDDSFDSKYKDDNLPEIVDQMVEDGTLTDEEYQYLSEMLQAASTAQDIEKRYKNLMTVVKDEPIYQDWLQYVYGVSTTLAAKLIYYFGYCGPVRVVERETGETVYDEERDGHDGAVEAMKEAQAQNHATDNSEPNPYKIQGRARISQLISYSGYRPDQTGRTRGKKLDYNPEAKTLMYIVADCIIKGGDRSMYRTKFYDPYKQKQLDRMRRAENMTDEELADVKWTPPNSIAHADQRARRYLAKKFLKHYWVISRDLQDLETPNEWVLEHGGHERKEDTFENPLYAKRILKTKNS